VRGFETGVGRQPLAAEQHVDLEGISRTLQCLLAEEGFADQPINGCPPRERSDAALSARDGLSAVQPANVERIVESVVAELARRGLT
jgi:4-hydroxy-tetrahydrodipicolinate synthase